MPKALKRYLTPFFFSDTFFLLEAHRDSEVNISGGSLGSQFTAHSGSRVDISGGSFGRGFQTKHSSHVEISGGEFRLDGVPIEGLDEIGDSLIVNQGSAKLLSGTLSDGTPFAFWPKPFLAHNADTISRDSLTFKVTELAPNGPDLIRASTDETPLGIRAGQTLLVDDGGIVDDNFQAGRASTLEISGGQVGRYLEAVNTQVNITGGSIGNSFFAYNKSEVNISGGSIGHAFEAYSGTVVHMTGGSVAGGMKLFDGSELNISGGSIQNILTVKRGSIVNISGDTVDFGLVASEGSEVNISGGTVGFRAEDGSVINIEGGSIRSSARIQGDVILNISGGEIGAEFVAYASVVNMTGGSIGDEWHVSKSTLNLAGGTIGEEFRVSNDCLINLFVRELFLDGEAIPLTLGEPLTILERGGALLEMTLADGSLHEFTLNDVNVAGQDYFHMDAVLTATLVPEPGSLTLLAVVVVALVRRTKKVSSMLCRKPRGAS